MTIFNEICKRVLSSTNRIPKILIGLFLSFLFFLPFAYGYLYRYAQQIKQSKDFELPEWTDWKGLLIDGFRFLAIGIPFFILSVLVGTLISVLLSWLFALIGLPSDFFLCTHPLFLLSTHALFILGILGIPTTISALIHFQEKEDFRSLLQLKIILTRAFSSWKEWRLFLLAFFGLAIVTAPLYPLSFFFGFLILTPYLITAFSKDKIKES